MNKYGVSLTLVCLLIMSLLVNLIITSPAKAAFTKSNADSSRTVFQDDAEKIELTCQYPVLSSYAGVSYSWDISVLYSGGKEPRTFDLKANIPEGFKAQITPGYGGTGGEIAAIRLDPLKSYPESIKLTVLPYVWQVPTPGKYPVSFEVSSGDIKSSINLTAIVTVNYDMKIITPDGRLNAEATAGQDSNFTVVVSNTGSGNLEKVTVESRANNRPSGWTVTFKPEKIESLPAGDSKEIQV
ncbi:MAG: NEW3 domain-containing protein, partial [Chloroflexi bacterium]|nr:NEW3 domain-containing protein [Chloroflexota bacterium]